MGAKVDNKSYFPGFYSMRDLNEDSSSSSWPLCYGGKTVTNGQYYNGFMPRNTIDGYPGCGKDALKHKMLEHEAVFKNQVYELHRLYRIQRDMMEDFRRKDLHRSSMEPSSSSSLRGPQVPSDEARKWHMTGFPLLNSTYERTSVSGVEIAMSCTKGNCTQPNQFPFQNGSSAKDSEHLDSRPLKLRKKLFDLELPADEYMYTEDGQKSPEFKTSHLSSYAPNVYLKGAPENKKFTVRHTGATTTDHGMDVSTSASCSRNPIWLADLNEPVDVEVATAPSSTDFLDHNSNKGHNNGVNHPSKSNVGFLGVNAKTANYGDGFFIKSSVDSQVNDRGRLSHIYEAGSSKNNVDSVNPGLQQDNAHPLQCMLYPHDHPPSIYPTRRSKEDLWGEGNHHPLESNRSHDQSTNRYMGPHISSHASGSDPFFSSSYFSGTHAHAVSSWAKPTESFTHKITSSDSYLNPAAAMNRGLQISAECRESYGGKWLVGDEFRSNAYFGSDLSTRKGFYHRSALESKELKIHSPSVGFDYLNCGRGDNLASNLWTNHGSGHFAKGISFADSKPAIDINLNEVVSKSSSNEVMILKNAAMMNENGKPMDHISTLPWLKNKPANANGSASPSSFLQASSSQLCCKTETIRDLNEPFTPIVSWVSSERNAETTADQNVKKILGFPIFETGDPKNEPVSHVSTAASFICPVDRNSAGKKRKNIVIDINLECEPEEQIFVEEQALEKENQAKSAPGRDFIDLNSCITDWEYTLAPSIERKTANVKAILEIDLESPVVLEKEDENTAGAVLSLLSSENRTDSSEDDALRTAAEAIVSISSSCPKIPIDNGDIDLLETSLAESFLWFVNAVSCPNELKGASINELTAKDGSPKDSSEEMDDFEAMTLQIPETKEEDYMPTPPFIPEVEKAEETTVNSLARPRRGQSRRGRQRRDFRRDILPGLTSLSRLEVAEDIQTFGGLMRATGHQWISGVGRRNGGGRGRRRVVAETASPRPVCTPLMQQLSKIEAGLEERVWGKTPRRPRRHRCHAAGNPPAVVLT